MSGNRETPIFNYPQPTNQHQVEYNPGRSSHNTSRLSHLSQDTINSQASSVYLGGRNYDVGSRVGKSFVIGDPHSNDRSQTFDDLNISKSITGTPSTTGSQRQLTKDSYPVLEKAYNFEYWNWTVVRFLCLGLVIIVMVALLAAVIGLVVVEKNRCQSPFKWWQGSVMYHISIPHFYNSDRDNSNLGDINGINEKIAYLNYLGVKIVVLSNYLSSDGFESTWSPVNSFRSVDKRIGTNGDFARLVKELHDDGIKIIIEMDPVYTAKSHPWFQDSMQHRASYKSPYENFYIWKDEKDSQIGTWEFVNSRNMYYYHRNNTEQPILDWNQVQVQQAFESEMEIWLKRGVDGFLIKNLDHFKTDFDETKVSIVKGWRGLLDSYSTDDFDHKVLCLEEPFKHLKAGNTTHELTERVMRYVDLVEIPFYLTFDDLTNRMRQDVIDGLKWQSHINGPWTYWKLSRMNKVEAKYATALMLYLLMLPGNPGFTAGQEIGRHIVEENAKDTSLLWRTESIFPYLPGSILNETTIAVLKFLSTLRENTFSLREDGYIKDEDTNDAIKVMSHGFPYIDEESIIIKRRFRRRDAYYFVGNFFGEPITRDWFDVAAWGNIVCETNSKMSGVLSLNRDLTLERGQGIVFKVQY